MFLAAPIRRLRRRCAARTFSPGTPCVFLSSVFLPSGGRVLVTAASTTSSGPVLPGCPANGRTEDAERGAVPHTGNHIERAEGPLVHDKCYIQYDTMASDAEHPCRLQDVVADLQDVERCIQEYGYKDYRDQSIARTDKPTKSSGGGSDGATTTALVKKTIDKNRTLTRRVVEGAEPRFRRDLTQEMELAVAQGQFTATPSSCRTSRPAQQQGPRRREQLRRRQKCKSLELPHQEP